MNINAIFDYVKPIKKIGKYVGIIFLSILTISILYICITHIEPDEWGLQKNFINGQIALKDPGLYFRPPWMLITKIPAKPIRVCISSTSKGYNAKLVQFNPETYEEFVVTEGWSYYWWANRFSFNSGYSKEEEHRGFKDIAKGYAYSVVNYPFFITIKEYGNDY